MKKKGLGEFSCLLFFLFILAASLQAQFQVVHNFLGGADDGSSPFGSLMMNGSTIYGMTQEGGPSGMGTIFKIESDGTGFTLLHSFSGGALDGAGPQYGPLIVNGSTLYGMTLKGGDSGEGTIFKIESDGTGFALLHSFSGDPSNGTYPYGSLIMNGSTLYGMTAYGGASGAGTPFLGVGTIFKIESDGTGFTLLHSFYSGALDGAWPKGSLILNGSTLYGMSDLGGATDQGAIFKINTDGTGFALLHSFAAGPSDGCRPTGSLIMNGSVIIGATQYGGVSDHGVIFKINTDGTEFTLLHSFAGYPSEGGFPGDSLTLDGSTLYGATVFEGAAYRGTFFRINTDGTEFTTLHSFVGKPSDGAQPYGSLIIAGSTLYGMTAFGGSSDLGTIFSYLLLQADVAVTKSVDSSQTQRGIDVNYTITAENKGPDGASGLKVTDQLPQGLVYAYSTPSQGTYDSATGVWDIGSLAQGNTVTLMLAAKCTGCGKIENTATRSSLIESDPDSANDSASVEVDIQNLAPVADDQSLYTNTGVAKNISLSATDPDGDFMTYIVEIQPSYGTLTGTPPDLLYTPNLGFHGQDSFSFKANDGCIDSNAATISILVNAPPMALNQSITTDENQAVAITLTATDPEGDALSFSVMTSPAHGTLSGVPPSLTYTPYDFYYGVDSFSFKANDGKADSNMATVSITVKRIFSFYGFDSPIDNQPVVNSAKAGSSVPVKWRITDMNGTPIEDPSSFVGLTSYFLSCGTLTGDPTDEVMEFSPGQSGLQYFGDGNWQFNWKTEKSYAGQCRLMVLKLADGSMQTAYFKFK